MKKFLIAAGAAALAFTATQAAAAPVAASTPATANANAKPITAPTRHADAQCCSATHQSPSPYDHPA